jgi:hypothetical protein
VVVPTVASLFRSHAVAHAEAPAAEAATGSDFMTVFQVLVDASQHAAALPGTPAEAAAADPAAGAQQTGAGNATVLPAPCVNPDPTAIAALPDKAVTAGGKSAQANAASPLTPAAANDIAGPPAVLALMMAPTTSGAQADTSRPAHAVAQPAANADGKDDDDTQDKTQPDGSGDSPVATMLAAVAAPSAAVPPQGIAPAPAPEGQGSTAEPAKSTTAPLSTGPRAVLAAIAGPAAINAALSLRAGKRTASNEQPTDAPPGEDAVADTVADAAEPLPATADAKPTAAGHSVPESLRKLAEAFAHAQPRDVNASRRDDGSPDAAASGTLFSAAAGTGSVSSPASAGGSSAPMAAPTPSTAAGTPTQLPVPFAGVPVLIAGKALAGEHQFDIRLDPPELGRIEVRLKVDKQGQISSHLLADRPDTLNLLRRDEAGLQRALQDAGLKTNGDGLQFSLRDQSGDQAGGRASPRAANPDDDAIVSREQAPRSYVQYSGRVGGLDIRI